MCTRKNGSAPQTDVLGGGSVSLQYIDDVKIIGHPDVQKPPCINEGHIPESTGECIGYADVRPVE